MDDARSSEAEDKWALETSGNVEWLPGKPQAATGARFRQSHESAASLMGAGLPNAFGVYVTPNIRGFESRTIDLMLPR